MNIINTIWKSITNDVNSVACIDNAAAIIIQRFVRQHRTSVDLLNTKLTCSLASRVYLTHYPTEHLMRFPEYVAHKARPDLKTWIDSNIPHPDWRTPRHIRNFFVSSGVRYEDVVHAGW